MLDWTSSTFQLWYDDYKTEISFAIVEGTCYGSRLTLGPFCRRENWPSSLFALSFRNKMQHRFVNTRFDNITNVSISCKSLVKIQSLREQNWKLCCDSAAIWRSSITWHTGVTRRIGISQLWFEQVWRSFLYILLKFGDIGISDPRVLDVKICTVGVKNFTEVTFIQ